MISQLSWKLLARTMRRERVFNNSRLNPACLARRCDEGLAVIEVDDSGCIIGYAAFWDTRLADVLELGSFFIAPSHRGQGLGTRLFGRCQEMLEREAAYAIALTNSKAFERIALQAGWQVDGQGDNFLARILLSGRNSLRSLSAHNISPPKPIKILLRSWRNDEVLYPRKVTWLGREVVDLGRG